MDLSSLYAQGGEAGSGAPPQQDNAYTGQQNLTGLQGWAPYMGVNYISQDPNNAQGNDFLNRVQKYDPNAHFVQEQYGGEGGGTTGWRLDVDQSKLPANKINGAHGTFGMQDTTPGFWNGHLWNGSNKYQVNDPTYGQVTDSRNVKDPTDWMDRIGQAVPLIVSLITAGAGAPLAGAAFNAAASYGNTGHINPVSTALSFLPGLNGLGGLDLSPTALWALRTGGNLAMNTFNRRGR